MGRIAEKGISYYSLKCDHINNKKVRLLINDCGSAGYWIWQCVLSNGYKDNGYFFDYNDKDHLELFATDTCKVSLEELEKVVQSCLRRKLFDQDLFDQYGILTCEMMQEIYIDATAERRRKGTTVELIEELILIKIPEDSRNISILPRNNDILPRKKEIDPRNNPQSKVKESKEDKSKEKQSSRANALVASDEATQASEREKKGRYQVLVKNLEGSNSVEIWNSLRKFIKDESPKFIDPYVDTWNVFATSYHLAKVETVNESRKKKFTIRIHENGFDFLRILEGIKASQHLRGSNDRGWKVTYDWIFENPTNWVKIIEGNYSV